MTRMRQLHSVVEQSQTTVVTWTRGLTKLAFMDAVQAGYPACAQSCERGTSTRANSRQAQAIQCAASKMMQMN